MYKMLKRQAQWKQFLINCGVAVEEDKKSSLSSETDFILILSPRKGAISEKVQCKIPFTWGLEHDLQSL